MQHGILFDHARTARIGLPEAVFCEGKPFEALVELLTAFGPKALQPVLFTRLAEDIFSRVPAGIRQGYDYHALSRTAFSRTLPLRVLSAAHGSDGSTEGNKAADKTTQSTEKSTHELTRGANPAGGVAIISAGTADGFVAWEAARTLQYLGIPHKLFADCGVAGLWRLAERLEEVNSHDAVIVVAGLDAALASVMGGLTPKPIYAVPTSVGYGAAKGGRAALASMLSSCAPGVGVMNIDNGYGAACAAARVINLLDQARKGV